MIGPALENRRQAILTFGVLLPLSIFVNVIGTWVDGGFYLGEIYAISGSNSGPYLFIPSLSPIVGSLQDMLQGNHIAIDILHLTDRGFPTWFATVAPYAAMILSFGSALVLVVAHCLPPIRQPESQAELQEATA
jgi:hypothetical protein